MTLPRVNPQELKDTLVAVGYVVRDPEKVRNFEEEEEIWQDIGVVAGRLSESGV